MSRAPADEFEHPDAGFRDGSPASGGVEPEWCLHFGYASVDPDAPWPGVDESVVRPAEQDSVVGVGGAGFGVVGDVVHFTPSRRHTAAGDDAAAVAEGERASLVAVEEAFLGAETEDAAVRGEGDALDDPGAPDMTGHARRDGFVAALDRRPAGVGLRGLRRGPSRSAWVPHRRSWAARRCVRRRRGPGRVRRAGAAPGCDRRGSRRTARHHRRRRAHRSARRPRRR